MNQAWKDLEDNTMSPEVYAKSVVAKVVKSNPPGQIWCGSGAFTVWLVETLNIHWAYSLAFSKMFGLDHKAPSSMK